MNTNTKDELILFIRSVQQLALGVVLITGIQTVSDIVQKCINLEDALEKDETIKEPK
jgi:hypothetical protein